MVSQKSSSARASIAAREKFRHDRSRDDQYQPAEQFEPAPPDLRVRQPVAQRRKGGRQIEYDRGGNDKLLADRPDPLRQRRQDPRSQPGRLLRGRCPPLRRDQRPQIAHHRRAPVRVLQGLDEPFEAFGRGGGGHRFRREHGHPDARKKRKSG
jgi:hypothetical protein